MAIVKPFKGIRPPKEYVEQVESRPYDVLNSEEARKEAEGNEKSLYHIIKPEIDFPVGTDEHDPRVYAKAAENFQKFQDKGWLVQDKKDCYYVYAQTMDGRTQTPQLPPRLRQHIRPAIPLGIRLIRRLRSISLSGRRHNLRQNRLLRLPTPVRPIGSTGSAQLPRQSRRTVSRCIPSREPRYI